MLKKWLVICLWLIPSAFALASTYQYDERTGYVTHIDGQGVDPSDSINTWRTHAYTMVDAPKNTKLAMVPIIPDHYPHLKGLYLDHAVMEYYETHQTYEFPKERFEGWVKRADNKQPSWWFVFQEKYDGSRTFVGASGAFFNPKSQEVDVCYLLSKNFWGKGFASTILPTMMKVVDDYLGEEYKGFVATAHPDNGASIHLLEKNGFQKNGVVYQNNAGRDRQQFKLSREQYDRTDHTSVYNAY